MSKRKRKTHSSTGTTKPSTGTTKQNRQAKPAPKGSTTPTAQPKSTLSVSRLALAPHPHNLHLVLFLLNVIVALLWQLIVPIFGLVDYVIGFVVGFVAISLWHRPYVWRAYRLLYFIGYVLWEILLSNLSIAKLVLQPKPKLDPGIIAVPLTVSTGLEIMILASVITLTPGTISVDLGKNTTGQQVLFVHNLRVEDPEAFRRSVKDGFERLLLHVTRGEAV